MHTKRSFQKIQETKSIWWWLIFIIVLAICLFFSFDAITGCFFDKYEETFENTNAKYIVVIDAGHGGNDPGKVGLNGELEKDINLSIAKILNELLTMNDVYCVMTRTEDEALSDDLGGSIKSADMRMRIKIMEEASPDLVVSIHQNSFTSISCKGAQVFYYTNSEKGMEAAKIIQASLKNELDSENRRAAKSDSSYYLLKKSNSTAVIVECGFLSNPEESLLLNDEIYQRRVAWAIFLGVMRFLNSNQ